MPNSWGKAGVGESANGTLPSSTLSRTTRWVRPVVGASLIIEINALFPSGGFTATTDARSMVISTTPSPKIPRLPVYRTVKPRIATASGVATRIAAFTVPTGATITAPLSPPMASRVSPLSMTMASTYVPGSTSTLPPEATMSIPS